nr:hypothetical protein [Thermoleophilaceae bacterium]
VMAGGISAEEERLLADPRHAGMVEHAGALPRPAALALQRSAGALVVLAAGARSIATGKLFEYLAARRPVLVLGEDSEAARIVESAGAGIAAPADDPGAIAAAIDRLAAGEVVPSGENLERYGWPALAERYAEVLARAVARRYQVR